MTIPVRSYIYYTLFTYNTFVGVGMLVVSLFMTARMGLYQETVYRQYGKHPKESLFFNVSMRHCFF